MPYTYICMVVNEDIICAFAQYFVHIGDDGEGFDDNMTSRMFS